MSFPEITNEEEKIFSRLATKIKLNSEINQIKIEIEKNAIKEQIEEMDLSNEQEQLKERQKVLEEEFEEISDDFPFLILKQELQTISVRLKKLEEKKDTISEKVYSSLYKEYIEKYNDVQTKFNTEERRIREIQNQCKNFIENLADSREELIVRSEIGDLSENDLKSKLEEFDTQKLCAQELISVTNQILD
ncbi:MAG: hypothetical protein HeimC3_17730 [Candidatus Heimdallarchaeota archaeon LC_3]|nr:MAG: hypothetical protein HeimC3_17730 [Candidatus Heimdallarchaeota archaeon LC_3]